MYKMDVCILGMSDIDKERPKYSHGRRYMDGMALGNAASHDDLDDNAFSDQDALDSGLIRRERIGYRG